MMLGSTMVEGECWYDNHHGVIPRAPSVVSDSFVCTLIIFVFYFLLPIVLMFIHCIIICSILTSLIYTPIIHLHYIYYSILFTHLRHCCDMSVTLR